MAIVAVNQKDVDTVDWIGYAIREIEIQHGATVSAYNNTRGLHKFGRNEAVGTTKATVMTLPGTEVNETYANIAAATNYITLASSSSAADGENLTITGHTVSSGALTRVTQTIALNGQTPVSLTTPLARVERAFNASNTALAGTVYLFENDTFVAGVPATDAKIHLMIPAGAQQSRKTALSTADNEYLVITHYLGSLLERAQNIFANVKLEVRETDGVWRQKSEIALGAGDMSIRHFDPPYIVKPNSDIRVTAIASGAGTDVAAAIDGVFLRVNT